MKSTVYSILGLVGLVALGAGLIFASASSGWPALAKILSIAGAALIALFIAVNRHGVRATLGSRSTAYGANLAVVFVLLVAVLGLVNAFASKYNYRKDLTHSGMFSLSSQTVNLLKGLDRDVEALAFFQESSNDRAGVEDMLKEYGYVSDRFKYQLIDPDKNPGITKRYGVTEYGTIVLECGDKVEKITKGGATQEEDLTNALLKVVREGKKKIYFVEGHGEADIEDTGRTGYSQAKEALESQNYDVEKLFLMRQEEIPEDCALLITNGPEKAFLETEEQAVERYLARGGKALFMLDPAPSTGMTEFFAKYGVKVGEDVVVDVSPAGRLFGVDEFMPMAMSYPTHAITEGFNVATLFPYARSVEVAENVPPGETVESFLKTGQQSWAETGPVTGEVRFDEGEDVRGPVSLGVAVTMEATDVPADTTMPSGETPGEESKPEARMVVIGDSEFANNSFLHFSGDEDFFLNIVSWLAEDEDMIAIRPKSPEDRRVALTARQTRLVMYLSLMVLPLSVLGLGVGVWLKRR
jgi:ABC-type uncharacterized transport system involved in gliding motility auxiliary subunit